MSKLTSTIKKIAKDTFEYHTESPSSLFKVFVSIVLSQFALLSLLSVSNGMKDVPVLEGLLGSSHYWWGLLGLFGASSILFEKYIKGNLPVLAFGYLSAMSSFVLLSYDFAASRPPIHTGGILSATASIFLGGLLYGRLKHR